MEASPICPAPKPEHGHLDAAVSVGFGLHSITD
jgi:hypothetical protein